MRLTINRRQRRGLMGGLEFISDIKLDLTQEEMEQIQLYITSENNTIGSEPPFFVGTTINFLRAGIEIKNKNVYACLKVEKKVIDDLIQIRQYILRASSFQGSYQFEVPLDFDDLESPEGFA